MCHGQYYSRFPIRLWGGGIALGFLPSRQTRASGDLVAVSALCPLSLKIGGLELQQDSESRAFGYVFNSANTSLWVVVLYLLFSPNSTA
jgi:hypothetical protein